MNARADAGGVQRGPRHHGHGRLTHQCVILLASLLVVPLTPQTRAQEEPLGIDPTGIVLPSGELPGIPESDNPDSLTGVGPGVRGDINFLSLMVQGGKFMIPILVMSLIAVTVAIERSIGLRRSRVLPDNFVRSLGQLGAAVGGFDPKVAYRICQQYPSAAANVVRAMLLKVGRPHGEVEHAVQETSQREAERLFSNVRWLNLAAAVSPLLGLLGTVWGMIVAFHDTTTLAPGQNKAEFLAEGIYIALVTTLGGLIVAIPSAVMSHFFEGRIQFLFHQIDEMVFSLMPQVERFEGRVRFNRQAESSESPSVDLDGVSPPPPPVAGRSAATK